MQVKNQVEKRKLKKKKKEILGKVCLFTNFSQAGAEK